MKQNEALVVAAVLLMTIVPTGCTKPQELPVVASPAAEGKALEWRDASGPLRGEVPWVLRTDVLGPNTYLVVETADGDRCANRVSFRVLAAGTTEYTVTLVSDLRGNVSWRVTYGAGRRMKLFSCSPRPAEDPRQKCIYGGIPKPLFGELVGDISAELVGGEIDDACLALRFERGYPCDTGAVEDVVDDEPL